MVPLAPVFVTVFTRLFLEIDSALKITKVNTLFLYYQSAILFGFGKSKEALLTLEKAIERAPRLLKKFIALNPSINYLDHAS